MSKVEIDTSMQNDCTQIEAPEAPTDESEEADARFFYPTREIEAKPYQGRCCCFHPFAWLWSALLGLCTCGKKGRVPMLLDVRIH